MIDVEKIIQAFLDYLIENELNDLPINHQVRDKNSCWSHISLKCFGDFDFKHTQNLKLTWERNSRNIKNIVLERKGNNIIFI